jgi:hypothetical protein
MNFFNGGVSDGFPLFFSFSDIPQYLRLGGKPCWSTRGFGYGVLGSILPVFRLRDVLAQVFWVSRSPG